MLYRYATRLLIERVSWLCKDYQRANDPDCSAELVFSNRSAMSYEDLCTYLGHRGVVRRLQSAELIGTP